MWGVTAGNASHNASNARGVTAGNMGRNSCQNKGGLPVVNVLLGMFIHRITGIHSHPPDETNRSFVDRQRPNFHKSKLYSVNSQSSYILIVS